MDDRDDYERGSSSYRIKPLAGSDDFVHWRRNARAYLQRHDPLLLGLEPAPASNSAAARREWQKAMNSAKGQLTLMLSEAVQVRAIEFVDDHTKTALDLWNFLNTTYTATNVQAVQNLRNRLEMLVYVEGASWEEHMNSFNSLVAQLAVHGVSMNDQDKKAMLIRTMPACFAVISTVASAQPEMTFESLNALVRAEIDRKDNPHNRQGSNSRSTPQANKAEKLRRLREKTARLANRRKKFNQRGNCFYCGKPGHFKSACRKRIRDEAQGRQSQPWQRQGRQAQPWQRQGNGHGRGQQAPNATGNVNNNQIGALISYLQNWSVSNNQPMQQQEAPPPHSNNPPFSFMAKLKFRANVAELSREKSPNAYIDSGATHNFFHRRASFLTYTSIPFEPVKSASGLSKIVGKGTVKVPIGNGLIIEAYHAPEFSSNILSVRLLAQTFEVIFSDSIRSHSACFFFKKGSFNRNDIIAEYPVCEDLFPVPMATPNIRRAYGAGKSNVIANKSDLDNWHRKLGHISGERFYQLSEYTNDVPKFDRAILNDHQCVPCIAGKLRRASIAHSGRKTSRPLELVHLDISGKVSPPSPEGYIYTVAFLDDFTAKSDVTMLKLKSELYTALVAYKNRAEVELQEKGYRLSNIRMDRAGENLSNNVKIFCTQHGIGLEPSPAYAPQSNGAAERLIQEHWTRARVMLFGQNLPQTLWPEAILHANWLRNRLPSSRLKGGIPLLAWDSKLRVNYSDLLEFGSPGFSFIYYKTTAKGKKMNPRSTFGHFVGMDSSTRLAKVYIPYTKQTISVRRSDFKEYKGNILPSVEALLDGIARQVAQEREENEALQGEAMLIKAFLSVRLNYPEAFSVSKKTRSDPTLPRSFNEACRYPPWCAAIDREYNALVDRGTWTYVRRQSSMKPVPYTWVFKKKPLDAIGKLFMEKARCCLRGDRQLAHFDYDPSKTYAPVASHDAIRMLIAIAAGDNLIIEGADVSNAYLYGDMDIPIIMEQPTNSTQKPAMPGHVCKLIKSIYGTKQAGEIWGSLLDKTLKAWGFKNAELDSRIYMFKKDTEFILMAIVVDDIAFASNSSSMAETLKKNLCASFDVKLCGTLSSFVGWNITVGNNGIKVDQSGYAKSILEEYGMQEANAVRVPLPRNADVTPAREDERLLTPDDHKLFRSMIGSLLYLAVCTRPDISFCVAVLARQVHAPTHRHASLAKRIIRYIAGTVTVGLFYPRSHTLTINSLVAHVDSDWGGCRETRKSTAGWIISINSTPIVWRVRKQTAIATSSAEAEYVAIFYCVKQVAWIRKLYMEMLLKSPYPINKPIQEAPTLVYCDNSAAISLAVNKQGSDRTKHMDLKYRFVEQASKGDSQFIRLADVMSKDNPADLLTKILDISSMSHLCSLIRLSDD